MERKQNKVCSELGLKQRPKINLNSNERISAAGELLAEEIFSFTGKSVFVCINLSPVHILEVKEETDMNNTETILQILDCPVSYAAGIREIRIRVGQPILIDQNGTDYLLERNIDSGWIRERLGMFAKHSLYSFEDEIRQGFITVEGGHRVGISGKVVMDGERIRMIKEISSLNIRFAQEQKGCADVLIPWIISGHEIQNTLFISPPGSGKTTMLRDVVRQLSNGTKERGGVSVSVVDERSEIGACFRGIPQCDLGMRTDIMDGCPKGLGMSMMIRSMAPTVLAVDEIGTKEDVEALREVMKCGCRILATVHGAEVDDLKKKPVFRQMVEEMMFDRYVVLGRIPHPGTIRGIYDERLRRLER